MGNHPPTNQAGQSHRHHRRSEASSGDNPSGRLGDHAGMAANLITIVLGVVSLVQAFRSDPLWILLGVLALTGLVIYWFHRRRWAFTVIGLVVLLTFGGGGWLLAYASDSNHPLVTAQTAISPTPTSPTTAPAPLVKASNASAPGRTTSSLPTIFGDVVQLDKETGVDLDRGQATKLYKQDATADLYLAWGYIFYSSARHSAMYDDSNAGSEDGAYTRCQTYRQADKTSAPHYFIGGGNQQYCFTTSDGHPGWVQAVNEVGDGGLILKVDVWQE